MKINLDDGRVVKVMFKHDLRREDRSGQIVTEAIVEISLVDAGPLTAMFTGLAYLHPNDRPCRRIGRKIALTRALKKAEFILVKRYRAQVWNGLVAQGMRLV